MNRKELLDKLKILQPALAAHGLIPALTHFWFDQENIMAYNDRIGILIPFKSGVKGCVPGATLIGLLNNSSATDVMLSPKDEAVEIKMGKANAELAMLPYDATMFEMPKADGKKFMLPASTLHSALMRCLRSTTDDTSVPEQLGVTLVSEDDGVYMYSTNGQVITRVGVKAVLKGRVVIPAEFCEQCINLLKDSEDKETTIFLAESHALLQTKKATLYGRLITVDNPLPFQQQFEAHFPSKARKLLIPIPGLMKTTIERSLVMAAAGDATPSVRLTIKGTKLTMLTQAFVGKSSIGKITDTLTLEKEHDDVVAELNPKALKAGLDTYTKMLIREDVVVLTDDDNGVFLISTHIS